MLCVICIYKILRYDWLRLGKNLILVMKKFYIKHKIVCLKWAFQIYDTISIGWKFSFPYDVI